MTNNFTLFKKASEDEFDLINDNNVAILRCTGQQFDLKKIEIKDKPQSFLFENFELVGLYFKDATRSYEFVFVTLINSELFSFRITIFNEKLSLFRDFKNINENERQNFDDDYIVPEFVKHKDFIFKQIENSPSERLINLLNK